ncbi:hypothetical protein ONZ45_g18269 [Pleurotus djamor]|nr:hypothetical protein ONZ45_g18269 [Pleurotus djamor]
MAAYNRIYQGAKLFAEVLRENKIDYILMGGGASVLLGCDRETKDLDFNLNRRPTTDVIEKFKQKGITIREHRGKDKTRMSASIAALPDQPYATHVDIAIKDSETFNKNKQFCKESLQIKVVLPDPQLLLVDKILTVTQRMGVKVSKELQARITDTTWEKFHQTLRSSSSANVTTYQDWCTTAGLEWPEHLKEEDVTAEKQK